MSVVSRTDASIEVASVKALGVHWRGWLLAALAIVALVAGDEIRVALQTPGEVIRHELLAAGSEVERLSWSTPHDRVESRIARHFTGREATVDIMGFPVFVTVSLHDLSRAACLDARRVARRIEGRVVIAVDRRTDAEPCRDHMTMTWRIMP